MPVALNREIRKTLNDVVRKARVVAEDGAQAALRQLGVADAKRPTWLSETDAALRVRLRAHAKTLGDALDTGDPARMPRLVREIAYAHWHRALFARFLLENGLLVDVDAGNAPVRPDELREIAEAEGRDVAEVAAEFAEPMLPEIFPKDDPVLALTLPPETRLRLSDLVDGLPAQTFKADDSLGWTYQFWQEDRKKKVNESEVKIGADELPAVTQLFTEDYMVLFLLENTLGAWWAGKKLAENPDLARDAADEDELRRRLSLPGYVWTYLRFVQERGAWRPAAGTFPGWPPQASAITVLDPCMGSGHFLVFALDILVALRKAEEALDDEGAVIAVLRDNLHGLEIDPRCTQIAAFALALAAWKRLGGVRPLPTLHLACSGLAIGMGKAEFVRLAEKIAEAEGFAGGPAGLLRREHNPMEEQALARRRGGLERLHDLFAQAPVLGSLIDPKRTLGAFGTLFAEGYQGLGTIIDRVMTQANGDPDMREAAVTAQGLAKAAQLLTRSFTLIATNVPYLGIRKQSSQLKDFIQRVHSEEKEDLATALIERFRRTLVEGAIAVVSPQNWFYQQRYRLFRSKILRNVSLKLAGRVGENGFSSTQAAGAFVSLAILDVTAPNKNALISSIDGSAADGPSEKSQALIIEEIRLADQSSQLQNPDHRITFEQRSTLPALSQYVESAQGVKTGDDEFWVRTFTEFPAIPGTWRPYQTSSEINRPFHGRSHVINWSTSGNGMVRPRRDSLVVGKRGLVASAMRTISITQYSGDIHYSLATPLVPKNPSHLSAILAFCESEEFNAAIRQIEQNIAVTTDTFGKVPFDLNYWLDVAGRRYPDGLPKPFSNDPTQWLFDGHPRGSANPNVLNAERQPIRPGMAEHPLQVVVARLLGYLWPRQTGSSFMDCPAIADPDEIEMAGVVDADGIVCLPAIHGEPTAHERVRSVLRAAWGRDWSAGVERACLEAEDWDKDLESWLADGFFDGHCKLFHQAPFIWHIWDGMKGGFSALVNYHKLCAPRGEGRRMLEKLRDTYLGEWIGTQRRLVTSGDATAEDRLAAAEHLRDELTAIIEGKPPYDIFVRWKPLHQQPIGWEPDINDGVRLNIRPFLTATTWRAKAKKACILRVMPGVKKHEGADRGGEPYRDQEDYPWFWAEDHDVATLDFAGGPEFKGRRYNDFHYTRSFKQAARDRRAPSRPPGSEAAE